jgi:hypothetical protein
MRWTGRIRHPHVSPGTGATSALLERAEPPAAPTPGPGCRVVVVGPAGMLQSLPDALPPTWTVEQVDEVGDLTWADLVVLTAPTPGKVAAVLVRQPDAAVIALARPDAAVDAVVELLSSGATACVRTAEVELVAAHLVACARRRSVAAG